MIRHTYHHKKITLLFVLSTMIMLSSCVTRTERDITVYQEINKNAASIQITTIDATDANYQIVEHAYIKHMLSTLAQEQGFVISDTAAEYTATLTIREKKFDKNLSSYYSIWTTLEIFDNQQNKVVQVLLFNNNTQSLQSSAYLYSLLEKVINDLTLEWVELPWRKRLWLRIR